MIDDVTVTTEPTTDTTSEDHSLSSFFETWEEPAEAAAVDAAPVEPEAEPVADEKPTEAAPAEAAPELPTDPFARFTPDAVKALTDPTAVQAFATEAASFLQENAPEIQFAQQVKEVVADYGQDSVVPMLQMASALFKGSGVAYENNGQQYDGYETFLGNVYQQAGPEFYTGLVDKILEYELKEGDVPSHLITQYGDKIVDQVLKARGVSDFTPEAWKELQAVKAESGVTGLTAEEETWVNGVLPPDLQATWKGLTKAEKRDIYDKGDDDYLKARVAEKRELQESKAFRESAIKRDAEDLQARNDARYEQARTIQEDEQRKYLKAQMDKYGNVFSDPEQEKHRREMTEDRIANQILYGPQHQPLRAAFDKALKSGNVYELRIAAGQVQKIINAEVKAAADKWQAFVPSQGEDAQLQKDLLAAAKAGNQHKLMQIVQQYQTRAKQPKTAAAPRDYSPQFEPARSHGDPAGSFWEFYNSQ